MSTASARIKNSLKPGVGTATTSSWSGSRRKVIAAVTPISGSNGAATRNANTVRSEALNRSAATATKSATAMPPNQGARSDGETASTRAMYTGTPRRPISRSIG